MRKAILLFATCLAILCARAQSSPPAPCAVSITGDFEPECLYDDKYTVEDEYPRQLIACKNSTVTYTAHAVHGTTAVGYLWNVFGDNSHTVNIDKVRVTWGDGDWGMLAVSVVNDDGDTCTETRQVMLVDVPTAGAVTIPSYFIDAHGDKVIQVCKGSSIQFLDRSSAGNSDIAGYLWSCQNATAPSAATPSYTIENILQNEVVTHRVYNNCGCYDEETFKIELLQGDVLDIGCYGTVCENAVVTYNAVSPVCETDYLWHVEGGTLIDGQNTPHPVVQWDRPHNGYGVLSLDGTACGETVCPTLMSRKIPVIHDSIAIEGPATVCVGEAVLYRLPLFGSTEYQWRVAPTTGVDTTLVNASNEARLVFNAPGTYTLRAVYRCDFLGCGPDTSSVLTVTVKPALAIAGEERICVTNACSLTVTPAVAAKWRIYDGDGVLIDSVAASSALAYLFPAPGHYLVTAGHPSCCGPATIMMEVRDAPPAPTVADLDPANSHKACLHWGLVLKGTPASPSYSLMWDATAQDAAPHGALGDSVTVDFGSSVCNVNVYHYDRTLQCRSRTAYVHTVEPLTLLPISIDNYIDVCPGTLIDWTHNEVPDQSADGVLYEWKIQEDKQYSASAQGSHQENNVLLSVHNTASNPNPFYVTLERRLCGVPSYYTIHITATTGLPGLPTISGPSTVCQGTEVSFSGSGGNCSAYRWEIEGAGSTDNPVSHTFAHSGTLPVTLYCNPYDYCDNSYYYNSAVHHVLVNPQPPVQCLVYDRSMARLSVYPGTIDAPAYSFAWYRQSDNPYPSLPLGYNNYLDINTEGNYKCVVTDNVTGCTKEVEMYISALEAAPCSTHTVLSVSAVYDRCSRTITAIAGGIVPGPGPDLTWQVLGGPHNITYPSAPSNTVAVEVFDVGTYTIMADKISQPCTWGAATVNVTLIPVFDYVVECNKIRVVNNSKYTNGNTPVTLRFTNVGNMTSEDVTFPVSQGSYLYTPPAVGTYEIQYMNGNTPCPDAVTVTTVSPFTSASLNSENIYSPHQTCDNTPIRLTATTNPSRTIATAAWTFSDGSSFTSSGNSICHTFGYPGSSPYTVSVSLTDVNGCSVSPSPFTISSAFDDLADGRLDPGPNNCQECPNGLPIDVTFYTHYSDNHYLWIHPDGSSSSDLNPSHHTYYSGCYQVDVINNNFCQRQANNFTSFLPLPVADIFAENTVGCVDQPLHLYGDNGPDPSLSYLWSVTSTPPGFTMTSSDPDITIVPPAAGTYTATLTVSNGLCSATGTKTVTINAVPAAPTIAVTGSPCISNAPVNFSASGFSGTLLWSNGDHGATASYYTPGPVEAWYFDPALGCPSAKAQDHIDRQPDFDALLTGCYAKCDKFFPYDLPVYGFTDPAQIIKWYWKLDNNTIASGNGNYFAYPLLLPLTANGEYELTVTDNNNDCATTSPTLTIDKVDDCACEGFDISVSRTMRVVDCHIFWDVDVTVCNRLYDEICVDEVAPVFGSDAHFNVVSLNNPGGYLNRDDCIHITMTLEVLSLEPQAAVFRTEDLSECGCVLEFAVDLTPDIACEQELETASLYLRTDLSSAYTGYFDFDLTIPQSFMVISVQSIPSMVMNWSFDGIDFIQGLGMFDAALLSQLAAQEDNLCFEVIACQNDELCRYIFCVDATELYTLLNPPSLVNGGNTDKAGAPGRSPHDGIRLLPNPTTGEVAVVGSRHAVSEVLVLDMHGKPLASFYDSDRFNVHDLDTGMYIVRVKTKSGGNAPARISYHKLVKK